MAEEVTPAAQPAPAAAATPAPVAAPAAPAAPITPAAPETFDRAYVEKLRQEAAGYRTKLQSILKAVEVPSDQPATADTVQAEIGKMRAQLKELKVTNALGEQFIKHSVKPILTKAMLESQGTLAKLDPDDAEFSKTLSGAIKKMADDYPELKVAPVVTTPTRSGAEFTDPGDKPTVQLTREQLKGMTPEQIMDAKSKGLLANLMGGAPA